MKIIICVDDDNGMLFNNRRQSRDRNVIEKIYEITKGQNLWITEFSSSLFDERATVDEDMLEKAEADDFCFIENLSLLPYKNKIDTLYLFKWNRRYPSDVKFDFILDGFNLVQTEYFAGNSHEKITLEVYINEKNR